MENLNKYPHPFVTVDISLFSVEDDKLFVCLSKREAEPFKGSYSFPGTFVHEDESAEGAVCRLLSEKLMVKNTINIDQLRTFSDIHRDPRGRVISIAYYGIVPKNKIDLPEWADWFEVTVSHFGYKLDKADKKLSLLSNDLAFDHKDILKVAIEKLQEEIKNFYSFRLFDFLEDTENFTSSSLQNIVKAVLLNDKSDVLNRGNFKKYVLDRYESLGYIEKVGKEKCVGKGRPKDTYRFNKKGI